jgi:hypothetical protein
VLVERYTALVRHRMVGLEAALPDQARVAHAERLEHAAPYGCLERFARDGLDRPLQVGVADARVTEAASRRDMHPQ